MEYSLEPIIITKELILSKVSEEELMEFYLGVPIGKGLFKSPLRNDHNPTAAFYKNKQGRLIMKDFGSTFCGDVFNVVQEKFQVSYYMALQIIANDFGIISRPTLTKNKPKLQYTGSKLQVTQQATIRTEIRAWEDADLDWWKQYGISKTTLELYKVYPIKNAWLNENLFYMQNSQKVYGYFGGAKNGFEYWRLYFPGRKRYKFVSNWKSNLIQGAHMLQTLKSDYLVITKSLKDCMVLYEFGIPAIAPNSETLFLSDAQYNKLSQRYKHIYVFYDTDLAGISNMNKIRRQYKNVIPIWIPRSIGYKDISDVRRYCGIKVATNLIDKALNYYGEKRYEKETNGSL